MSVLRPLFELILLRRGPQDLPYSSQLTLTLVGALLAAELLYTALLDIPMPAARLLLSLALLLGWPWLLLTLRNRRPRFTQTVAALSGSALLFTLAFLPLALLASAQPAIEPDSTPAPGQLLLGWLILFLLGWKLMVEGHIYRHALDWPRFPALLLALALFMIEFGLFRSAAAGAVAMRPERSAVAAAIPVPAGPAT